MLLCSTDMLNLPSLRVDTWESNSEPTLHWAKNSNPSRRA